MRLPPPQSSGPLRAAGSPAARELNSRGGGLLQEWLPQRLATAVHHRHRINRHYHSDRPLRSTN